MAKLSFKIFKIICFFFNNQKNFSFLNCTEIIYSYSRILGICEIFLHITYDSNPTILL